MKLFEVVILSEKRNIVKYRKSLDFNIGFVIFFIIIVYVLFNIFSYFSKSDIAEYEVVQGKIASNYIYQGVIIRDETVEYADKDGYVNYYVKNGSKVSTSDVVYSIDTIGTISEEISSMSSEGVSLSSQTIDNIYKDVMVFINDYDSDSYYKSYDFFDELSAEITHNINNTILNDLSVQVTQAEENHTFFKYSSPLDGIVVYYTDGYEQNRTEDYITNGFSFSDYKKSTLESNRQIEVASPVYKRVNSEHWKILIEIEKKLARELLDGSVVKIRFCKDDYIVNANYEVIREGDKYYLELSLKTAMIRYVNDRFVDIELVMGDDEGLKIPKTAITSKEFFTIPKSYFTVGGDSDDLGILVKKQGSGSNVTTSFITPTIYYENEDFYFIDNEEVSNGDTVLIEHSVATYTIGTDTDSLIGVYNINKGYAVFKQINIIFENEEYAIVETKTAYGISLYDHIALDASKIKEHQLTTK